MITWNDNRRITLIVRQIKGLRVILSSLVLEELGSMLLRIRKFLTFLAHRLTY